MHKILFSQQLDAVEELLQEGVGDKARGYTAFGQLTAACVYVCVGVLETGSGSQWRLKCNEVRLKGAAVTGKQGSESKKCAVIKGGEEKCPCFGVAHGI